ncbi:histone H2A.4 [Culex quinquefasciatus]|uniref:Histone H2A.4 n=1 Tax=Culex quinquefasciatus TaxID=7176 RepID=B0WZ29_CULQU|nr:histone H2A.4 [Culex quinquefasciatus]|eukprot:XP_001862651.1 histone H2A.4 [Culex quinquefasciatus]
MSWRRQGSKGKGKAKSRFEPCWSAVPGRAYPPSSCARATTPSVSVPEPPCTWLP